MRALAVVAVCLLAAAVAAAPVRSGSVVYREDLYGVASQQAQCNLPPVRTRVANSWTGGNGTCVAQACATTGGTAQMPVAVSCPAAPVASVAQLSLTGASYVVTTAYSSGDPNGPCAGVPVYLEALEAGDQCREIGSTGTYIRAACNSGAPLAQTCTDSDCLTCTDLIPENAPTVSCVPGAFLSEWANTWVTGVQYACVGQDSGSTTPVPQYVTVREEVWLNDDSIGGCEQYPPTVFLADAHASACPELASCVSFGTGQLMQPSCFASYNTAATKIPSTRQYVIVDVYPDDACATAPVMREGINLTGGECVGVFAHQFSFEASCTLEGLLVYTVCQGDVHCTTNCQTITAESNTCLPIGTVPNIGAAFGSSAQYAHKGLSALVYCSANAAGGSTSHGNGFNTTAVIGGFVGVLGFLTIGTLVYAVMTGRARERAASAISQSEDRVALNDPSHANDASSTMNNTHHDDGDDDGKP